MRARVQFLLKFGSIRAKFAEALVFLRDAYEPHCARKNKKTYAEVRRPTSDYQTGKAR